MANVANPNCCWANFYIIYFHGRAASKTADADETQIPHDNSGVLLLVDNKTIILPLTTFEKLLIHNHDKFFILQLSTDVADVSHS